MDISLGVPSRSHNEFDQLRHIDIAALVFLVSGRN